MVSGGALAGQVAVVTGASRGIGKGIALELGAVGATVYVTGRTTDDSGIGKAAVDRMAGDMAVELRPFGVTCVSLWPGVVRTELMEHASARGDVPFTLENGETPRFTGRGVVALASDPDRMAWTGSVIPVTELAAAYDFCKVDGRQPEPLPVQMGLQEPAS